MESNVRAYKTRTILGSILIVIGALFLLKSMGIIFLNIPRVIFSFPFLLFMVGVLILINSRNRLFGLILTFIGGFWLLPRIFPALDIDGGVIAAVVIIGLGIYIILKNQNRPQVIDVTADPQAESYSGKYARNNYGTIQADFVDEVAIFGGSEKNIHSENFRGGNITAIFGGCEINLSSCKLAEGTNVIDVLALFGGAEIRVPRDWQVIVNATPIFGGFSNKVVRDPSLPIDMSRTLLIKGLAMFGGIEINSKY